MRRKRLKPYQRAIITWIMLFCVVFGIFIWYFETNARPILKSLTINSGQSFATDAVNIAVQDVIEKGDYSYENLIDINRSDAGDIKTLNANTENINLLKTQISLDAQKNISKLVDMPVNMSLGVLTGIELFKNLGPPITVTTTLTGGVTTEFVSKIQNSGINQTLHSIELHIKADISVYSSGVSCDTSIETNVIIAQTVIVGTVPQLLYSDDYSDVFDDAL